MTAESIGELNLIDDLVLTTIMLIAVLNFGLIFRSAANISKNSVFTRSCALTTSTTASDTTLSKIVAIDS